MYAHCPFADRQANFVDKIITILNVKIKLIVLEKQLLCFTLLLFRSNFCSVVLFSCFFLLYLFLFFISFVGIVVWMDFHFQMV